MKWNLDDLENKLNGASKELKKCDENLKQTAENILYWMADAYQQSADYENALMLLNKIAISGNLRMDDALVKKGLLHRKRGEEQLAIAAFENVVNGHPDSEYIRLAQMELKKSAGAK